MSTTDMPVAIVYNAAVLSPDHPDYAADSGVLESVEAIAGALESAGFHILKMSTSGSIAVVARELEIVRPAAVVNLCEGLDGDSAAEPHVAALFELLGLPYTGSPPECLALVRDKAHTKRLLVAAGVDTPQFVELRLGEQVPERPLRQWLAEGPLFVKPAREDASLGIDDASVVTDWTELQCQVTQIHDRYGTAIVEQFVAGREFNVGIVELDELQVLPAAEIDFLPSAGRRWPILAYAAKWRPESAECISTPVICPAKIDAPLAKRLETAAVQAYRLTGCRDYARVDLRTDEAGNLFVLEVNANPDLSPTAGLARMLAAAGIDYGAFVQRLVETARERAKGGRQRAEHEMQQQACPLGSVAIRGFVPADCERLLEIARSCAVFRPDELEIAAEVLYDAAKQGAAGHYQVLVAEAAGRAVGWSCHGRVPLTDATFDLYWIVIQRADQRLGIGRALLADVEQRVRSQGGRWLLAETSSTSAYDATRAFYHRCGYSTVSQIEDFYRAADGKITFGKRLDRT